jgi:predicted nucleic acid-binding Zn ribbon protein
MQRAGSILKKFVRDYGLEAGLTLTIVRKQWLSLVGQTIASHTSPDIIRGSTLHITVDTPQWIHHLSFYKHDICEKLKPYKISEIRFKRGRLPEREDSGQEVTDRTLTDEDIRSIENMVQGLEDKELRQRFQSLLTHAFMRGKK